MIRQITEDGLEKNGNLVSKKQYEFEGRVFEFRVYLLANRYIGRVYLNGKRHNPNDYVQEYDAAMIQKTDIFQRFFENMISDLENNQL